MFPFGVNVFAIVARLSAVSSLSTLSALLSVIWSLMESTFFCLNESRAKNCKLCVCVCITMCLLFFNCVYCLSTFRNNSIAFVKWVRLIEFNWIEAVNGPLTRARPNSYLFFSNICFLFLFFLLSIKGQTREHHLKTISNRSFSLHVIYLTANATANMRCRQLATQLHFTFDTALCIICVSTSIILAGFISAPATSAQFIVRSLA